MQDKLVSIIIPVYNAENYLNDTIQSVIDQTYKNLEILIVNDGSKDNSLTIANSFAKRDNRIKVYSINNIGQCGATNIGLAHSKGVYIKFFDADDVMNSEHIEFQLKKLNGRTDAIASCEWGRFYNSNPESAKFIPEPVWQDMKPLDWLKTALSQKADMMAAWLWLIPRQIIEKSGGWDVRLNLNNDFEFCTRLLLCANEVLFAPGAKVYYRSGLESSLANIKSEKNYKAALLSTNLGCKYLLEAEDTPITRSLCANRYQEWAYRIYPNYPEIIKEIENWIKELGGSTKKMDGGMIFRILQFLLGWKKAKHIQLLFYKFGYSPKYIRIK
jgi:glycosyltransferase involved in cell wall biosynthesis